jgi:hypothetical protein
MRMFLVLELMECDLAAIIRRFAVLPFRVIYPLLILEIAVDNL